jgi:divalent metal cation (Fe/Co/Zn/Cd) transporter
VTTELTADERARWHRWALYLAYFSVAYNVVEAIVSIGAGIVAGSVALTSFGGDSVVESLSALVIVWQFRSAVPEDQERRALRFIGGAFFILAAYITVDALRALFTGPDANASPVGVVIATASLIVMPALAVAKRRVGHRLGSAAVLADSTQTLLCMWLSAALLMGLLLNTLLGWGWADPVTALVIAAFATHEGLEAWRGEEDD